MEFSIEDEIVKLTDLANRFIRYDVSYFKIWTAEITHNRKCVHRADHVPHTRNDCWRFCYHIQKKQRSQPFCFCGTRKPFPEGP